MKRQLIPLIALFVALGGTSYAAVRFPPNSIGAKQLKRNAVTQPKIKNGAVNGAKIADDSVRGADVLESSLGKVPRAFHVDSVPTAANAAQVTSTQRARKAASAPHAADATQLGGQPSGNYQLHFTSSCGPGQGWGFLGSTCTSQVIPFATTIASGQSESFLIHQRGFDFRTDVNVGVNCNNAFGTSVSVLSESPAKVSYFYTTGTTVYTGTDALPGSNFVHVYGFDDKRLEGQFIWAGPGGKVVTIKVHAVDLGGCEMQGTAVFAGF